MEPRPTDLDLLERFAKSGNEQAFAELVQRHIHWVSSMAGRLVHDRSLADDVAQSVFILLARRAKSLHSQTILATWLFTVTRYCAKSALRNEMCRRKHETSAATMTHQINQQPDVEWQHLAPMLDGLVNRLRTGDREALLLRFYEQKSFPEIGVELAISEEAARKRVNRAVEKLRDLFARKGIAVGAGALVATLAVNTAQPASAALTAGVTGAGVAAAKGGAAGGSIAQIIERSASMLWWSTAIKPMAILIAITAAAAGGMYVRNSPRAAVSVSSAIQPVLAPVQSPVLARSGRVIDPNGNPVTNARVMLVVNEPRRLIDANRITQTQQTDAAGQFLIWESEKVSILVSVPGFGITGAALPFYLSRPREIRLREPASLFLRLVDAMGEPVAGARVIPKRILDDHGAWDIGIPSEIGQQLSQTTDRNGICELRGLPRNSLIQFSVAHDHFADLIRSPKFTIGPTAGTDIGDIRLDRAGIITGKVTLGPNGLPAANIVVGANSTALTAIPGYTSLTETQTDANGIYRLVLRPGTYNVCIGSGFLVGNEYAPANLRGIPVAQHQTTSGIDFALTRGTLVRGRVIVQGSGNPISGVELMFADEPQTSARYLFLTTNERGEFQGHVAPGQYGINTAKVPDQVLMSGAALLNFAAADEQEIVLSDIELPLRKENRVRGRVVDQTGQPVSNAEVFSMITGLPEIPAPGTTVETNESGEFEITVGNNSRLGARKGAWTTLETWPINGKSEVDPLVLHKDSMASVAVLVTDEEGTPVPQSSVQITRAIINARGGVNGWSDNSTLLTDLNGRCVFDRLEPYLQYSFNATAKNYIRKFEGSPISVEPGKQAEFELKLVKTGVIAGMVVGQDGAPVEDVVVSLTTSDDRFGLLTDAQGRFRFSNIREDLPAKIRLGSIRTAPTREVNAGDTSLRLVYEP